MRSKSKGRAVAVVMAAALTWATGCAAGDTASEEGGPEASTAGGVSSIELVKLATFANAARPEIVVTDDRVFVIYLSLTNPVSFSVKIFNRGMTLELASKVLVPTSATYGKPTDIRVAKTAGYLYAFYETLSDTANRCYLFGARYSLDDAFEQVGSTDLIATGKFFLQTTDGDELLNDPAVLVAENSVFSITRYKSSLGTEGATRYKVYEFTKDLSTKTREFDLDLSSVADGQPRQTTAISHEGYYYMAIGTTVGPAGGIEMMTPSDLVIVKLNTNWSVVESKNISTDSSNPDDVETYFTGLAADSHNFYLDYVQIDVSAIDAGGFVVPLKIYDRDFNLVAQSTVRTKQRGENGLRPSLELTANQVFVGNSGGTMGSGSAEIYIYDIVR